MTAQEYLKQAQYLDQRIDSDMEELSRLRALSEKISALSSGERVSGSKPNEAPFVRTIEKIIEMEGRINREVDLLVDLKEEIRTVIDALPDRDESMILRYRYLHGYAYERIAAKMNAAISTVKRWHSDALLHVTIPTKNFS